MDAITRKKIEEKINNFNYHIENINISSFEDFDRKFEIYNVELKEEIEDYPLLLAQEQEIKQKLSLFSKNIILELV